jgi:DNA-binding NarL/FixJ family response regulator
VIRVGLVDDQTLVRAGIRALLSLVPDVEVVFEAEDGAGALRILEAPGAAPDVILLDLRMPGLDGISVLRALRSTGRLPPTIVLTTFDDDALMLEAVRLGARGFLLKDISLERLAEAIRTVAAGGTLLQPAVTERLLRAALGTATGFDSSLAPEPLTEREIEVLRLMASGCNNREIADSLGMAEGTAKNHISNILAKLGVRDRTRAVLKALELGLV